MVNGHAHGTGPGRRAAGSNWRRLAIAGPVSVLLHLVALLAARPDYAPVSDFAVELEVLELEQGAPAQAGPEIAPTPPEEPEQPEPEQPPEQEIAPEPDEPSAESVSAGLLVDDIGDAGVSAEAGDAGVEVAGGPGVDGGTGEGTGICMHDLFPFGEEDPAWVLWLSMASFRETAYQRDLGRTLQSFALYKRMAGATGMSPEEEVEGLLVTADNVFDWRTFRVVATYDSGEEGLRSRLMANRGAAPGFSVRRTDSGYEAAIPGAFRWHLVGSGRVLAVTHEPPADGSAPLRDPDAPLPAPDNPYADEAAPDGDAGIGPATPPAADAGTASPDAGSGDLPALPPPTYPAWPRRVTCMTELGRGETDVRDPPLIHLARTSLGPDPEGHWPVALLVTRDPRAVGLGRNTDLPVRFRHAVARAYFSEPIRIEGTVAFDGRAEEVAAVEAAWRRMTRAASKDPFLAMSGLASIFAGLEIAARGNEIHFTLPMTEAQIQAALLFIQLQGEALERRTLQRSGARPPRPPRTPKK